MARNRKYQSAAIRFGPALKAFLLCLLIGGSAVGYVWQKNQLYQLGQQLNRNENRLEQARALNRKLEARLQDLRDPKYLKKKNKDYNLGLVEAQRSQIWQLPEPPRDSFRPAPEQQYAVQDHKTANH